MRHPLSELGGVATSLADAAPAPAVPRPAGGGGAEGAGSAIRTLVVWCPDWPLVAAGVAADVPAAVLVANRVVACTAAARAEGVRRGLRRREAQARCPELHLLAADADRDARRYEAVVAAVAELAPRAAVIRPGLCAVPTRGPSRYFGGDEALVARVAAAVAAALPAGGDAGAPRPDAAVAPQVGVADGLFAAGVAARRGVVVPAGGSAAFLAPLPLATLATAVASVELADLVAVLRRLGLRTLGQLADLGAGDLSGRFGREGLVAHRLASGLDEQGPGARRPPPDLAVAAELDPPAERIDTAAFVAKSLADELHARLADLGLACTRVLVEAETAHGERLGRLWRHEGALTAAAMAERVRWQLDGWLHAGRTGRDPGVGLDGGRPSAGIAVLRLVPDQVVPDSGRQLGFWGGAAAATERAARAVARVQALLGPDAVLVAERRGGRGPAEQVALLPAHAVELGAPATVVAGEAGGPWPGRLPPPAPALVPPAPVPATLLDAGGAGVVVTGRGLLGADPHHLVVGGGAAREVVAWAGPWPAEERWWDPAGARRQARLQVHLADGTAHLLVLEHGRWAVEATYD